ncbi:hypothetical protein HH311_28465, partial [Actinomycetospora sp. TBRC 11914]|nr:hypothetical protein [Actinomycetospora sp. TBRC 11914]
AEAHVYLRLLHPDLVGADDTTIITTLTEELLTPNRSGHGPDDDGPDDSGPDDSGPDDSGPDDSGPDDSGPDDGPDDSGPDDSGPDDSGPDDSGPDDSGPDDSGPDDSGPRAAGPEDGAGGAGPGAGPDDAAGGAGPDDPPRDGGADEDPNNDGSAAGGPSAPDRNRPQHGPGARAHTDAHTDAGPGPGPGQRGTDDGDLDERTPNDHGHGCGGSGSDGRGPGTSGGADGHGPAAHAADGARHETSPDRDTQDHHTPEDPDHQPSPRDHENEPTEHEPGGHEPGGVGSDPGSLEDGEPPPDGPGEHPGAEGRSGRAPVAFRSGVAVRLELTTLLRRDQRPGEVPGYGTVVASTARHLARTRDGAATRLLLYDPDGHLEHVLTLPPLGARGARRRGRHRKQVVELTAHTHTLDDLDPTEHLGRDATLLTTAHAALARARARPTTEHPANTHAESRRRHPGAELAAWITARDQTCRFPGCDRPALRADLDHTRDWLHSGPTLASNLGALCESHHRLKHEHPDWALTQPEPGTFLWSAPTGTTHTVTAARYKPAPAPLAPTEAPMSIPDLVYTPPPRTPPPWAARRNQHGHLTDPACTTAARLTQATTHTAPQTPPSPYDHDPDF